MEKKDITFEITTKDGEFWNQVEESAINVLEEAKTHLKNQKLLQTEVIKLARRKQRVEKRKMLKNTPRNSLEKPNEEPGHSDS